MSARSNGRLSRTQPPGRNRAAKAKSGGAGRVSPKQDASTDGLCPIARTCGACPRIGVSYPQQLAEKQERMRQLFADLADPDCVFAPILGMDDPQGYRNKIASPFAPGKPVKGKAAASPRSRAGSRHGGPGSKGAMSARREILCGMFAPGTHRIIPVESCPVEHPAGRQVVNAVRDLMARYGVEPYDEDAGTGFLRHVVVRVGAESGEVLVTLVTAGRAFPGSKNFCRELVRRCPQITTVVQNVNPRVTNAIFGDEEQVLYGPGFILDTLCGLSFRISSHSFYQVNARQTEVLYRTAIALAAPGEAGAGGTPAAPSGPEAPAAPGEAGAPPAPADTGASTSFTLIDAYCGTGTIGLVAARLLPGAQVVGVEKVESAVRDARQNARHNGIENAEFFAEDAGAFLRRRAAQGQSLDVLMMDPPRSGASEEFLRAALSIRPARIVYISCNPETQARDAHILCDAGYRLMHVQPVDMFPHTDHVETVVLLSKST